MITASKLELVRACPASVTVPWRDEDSPEAQAGRRLHKEWEDRINAGDIPDELEAQWAGYSWRSEVPFAWSLADGTGRELPPGDHRDYSAVAPLEIAGTCDIVGRSPDGTKLVIADKKSFMEIAPAARNAQIHIAALALSRAYGIDDVDVAIFHEIHRPDIETLDQFALDAFADEARAILEVAAAERQLARVDVDSARLRFKTGPQCRYCPAFHDCPRQKALREIVASPSLAQRVELAIPMQDDATALEMYQLAERIGMLSKRLNSALHARAAERPIPLGDGTAWGAVATAGKRKLNGDVVWQQLTVMHGRELADAAVKRVATQKGIGAALKTKAARGQLEAMKRSAMTNIEAAGGIAQKPSVTFKVMPIGSNFRLGAPPADDDRDEDEDAETEP